MKTIWMTVEDTYAGEEAWIEQWTGYLDSLDEEYAANHILETLDDFNANLYQGEQHRTVISFVLEKAEAEESG